MALVKDLAPEAAAVRASLCACILDDDPQMVELLTEQLERMGFRSAGTTNPEEALEHIRHGRCQVVVTDLKMPGMNGLEFLQKAQELDPDVRVILMTGYYSLESAVEAIKSGAYDYLPKPVDTARLEKSLAEIAALEHRRHRIREIEETLLSQLNFHGIVGRSPAILEQFELAQKIARHYSTALITGPTGSGKEVMARALHEMSPVARERFVVCNCSALMESLLESQLFGHVRGAFTGATESRAGLFEYAHGGTLFLDEIGEMSPGMQARLLRAIQNREIQRVGSPSVRKIDVRVIAATNRDLRTEVAAGRFREDLFYRLSTIHIRVPSLAERAEDISLLAQYFLRKYSQSYGKKFQGFTRRAQAVLLQHSWPGNVRELENVVAAACLTSSSEVLDLRDLPAEFRETLSPRRASAARDWQPLPLDEVRRQHIERVLEMCNGNRVRAARILGIGRTSLYRFLKRSPASDAA
jgi:DNA-binding NtrC family response regulator